jgi:hypothetical protein
VRDTRFSSEGEVLVNACEGGRGVITAILLFSKANVLLQLVAVYQRHRR